MKQIGKGAFGKVYDFSNDVALKVFKPKNKEYYVQEVRFLELCRGPHVVQMLGSDPDNLHIQLERLKIDSHELTRNEPLTELEAKAVAYGVLVALARIHKLGVIHGDVKPENIMFGDSVKLIDFGGAVHLDDPFGPDDLRGTAYYRAPEIVLGLPVRQKVDVWALACTIFELITGEILFDPERDGTRSTASDHIMQMIEVLGPIPESLALSCSKAHKFFVGKTYQFDYLVSPNPKLKKIKDRLLRDLLKKMLTYDPAERPGSADCLNHAWFSTAASD